MRSKEARLSNFPLLVAMILGMFAVVFAAPKIAFAEEGISESLPLDFIYVESRTIEVGETQNVVVAFPEDGPEVVSATLTFGRVDQDEWIEVPSNDSSENAFAFSMEVSGDDAAGNYQLKSVLFSFEDGGVVKEGNIDLTASDQTANNTFTVVESLVEARTNSVVEMTAYTVDDGGGLREVESLDDLALPSTLSRTKTSRPVVVLDPGHGGYDPGAMSNGLVEKDLTLAIAKYCKAGLSEYAGISVSMTRESDVFLDLDERVDIAIAQGATLFVSIHINSGGGVGAEVWVPNKSSWCYEAHEIGDELGNRILEKLSALGLASRGNKFDSYTLNGGRYYPDGSPADALAVIRYSREAGIPGVLIEHGFIDNSHDASLLSSDYYLRQWGIADASAIAEQLGAEKAKFWLSGIALSPESGQLVGASVEMKALVAGDVSGLSYKFVWHKAGKDWSEGNWGVIQDKSSSNAINWIPTEAGNYEIICDVVGANGSVQSVTVSYRVSSWALSSVEASPSEVQLGDSVTVAPVVSGETAGLRYKYSVVDLETGAWSLLAAPSADASLTWEPPAAGSYAVTVDVIDGGSYVSGSATVEVGEDWSLDSFSADSSPAFVGRPVELEASVSGTTSGLTYKFVWERGGWADWGVASERSADPSATWTPDAPGSYTLYCDVVDSRGNVSEYTIPLEVSSRPWALSSVEASPSEVQLGDSVTVAPVVSGETAGLRYKYSVVDLETGAWSLLAAPSADASLTWEPPAAGSYAVTVDVIDGGSYVSGSATVEVGEDWSLDSFSADPSPAFVGRPVELEASVSGTTSGLTYKFVWERGGWADWGVASERSADPSATWTPDAPGSYTLYCDVVDSRGNVSEYTVPLEVGGTAIMGSPQTTIEKMVDRYESTGHVYPSSVYKEKGAETIEGFCRAVYTAAVAENVRPEILFSQAMYETGWLQFGGSVKAEQCNFGGLGAVNAQAGGAVFPNVSTGLLAQAQHLKAYASTDDLNEALVDPRFDYVSRGCAPYLEMLDGKWAVPGNGYGKQIASIVETLI